MKNNLDPCRPKLVDIDDIISSSNPLLWVLKKPAEKILGLSRINRGYADAYMRHGSEKLANNFFELICDSFDLAYEVDGEKVSSIPNKGPVVVLSNHPYGLADGLLLGKLLTSIRCDVKLVANGQLEMCEEIKPWMIAVDPFETYESKKKNLQGMREMLRHLKNGGMLGVFPAGSASSFSLKDRCVIDDEWNENIAALVRKTNATVVTVHFPGRNSLLFQGVSMIKKGARAALLPREFKRQIKSLTSIEIGSPIEAKVLKRFETNRQMIDYLKVLTYCQGRKAKLNKSDGSRKLEKLPMELIMGAVDARGLSAEVANLPNESKLVESGNFSVYVASATQIPLLLSEIGRLREITFRGVGEGSGTACDIDEYDAYYKQLFLWDHDKECLVGGYRFGETDKIIAERGIRGLYNSRFFDFKSEVFKKINPGLEMGRSFIIKEYQRKPLMLGLIWQGIGRFVAKNADYRYLFGVVSTSAEYDTFSFKLIADFLRYHAMDEELAPMIKAKNPLKGRALKQSELDVMLRDQADEKYLTDLVSQLEDDCKGIPVLLRQYLKLNGKILGFNIDDDFGGVLDCMVLVDLHKSPRRSLEKYMGKQAVAEMMSDR